jgi:hypothetical protein
MSRRRRAKNREPEIADVMNLDADGERVAQVTVDKQGDVVVVMYLQTHAIRGAKREECAAKTAVFLGCDHETAYELLFAE